MLGQMLLSCLCRMHVSSGTQAGTVSCESGGSCSDLL